MPSEQPIEELMAASAGAGAIKPTAIRSAKDYLALVIATCGVGYFPIAPGTWGSAVGVGLWLLLREAVSMLAPGSEVTARTSSTGESVAHLTIASLPTQFIAMQLIVITIVTLVGIWAASRAERIFQKKDPGRVVIDEVAGQLIALLPIPLTSGDPWPGIAGIPLTGSGPLPRMVILVAASFLLFRAFDIIKPHPVRQFESLKSGLGIVADDLGAGAYAAVIVAIAVALYPL